MLLPLSLPPPDPVVELFVATRGMSQGIAQTDGIQVRPRLVVHLGDAQLGAQWRNITSPAAKGVAMFFVRYGHRVGKVQFDGAVAYRVRTGVSSPFKGTAWEVTGTARRSFKGWGLRLELQYSPQDFGNGQSLYLEAGPTVDLGPATTVSANVGRRERQQGPDYASFNVGFTTVVKQRLSVDARLFDTNRGGLGAPFRSRIAVSARLTL